MSRNGRSTVEEQEGVERALVEAPPPFSSDLPPSLLI